MTLEPASTPAPAQQPHGAWESPISVDDVIATASTRPAPQADGALAYWLTTGPDDGGRVSLVRRRLDGAGAGEGEPERVSPQGANVRTRVHEYGGGEYAVREGWVVWSDVADGSAVHALTPTGDRIVVVPGSAHRTRFADFVIDSVGSRIVCVRETHPETGDPVNELVALPLHAGGEATVIREGRVRADRHDDSDTRVLPDFVLSPAVSPDGTCVAWVEWSHPAMPWQDTTLCVTTLDEHGRPGEVRQVARAGGLTREAFEEPLWLDNTTLLCLNDRTGFTNVYRVDTSARELVAEPVTTGESDFGTARWAGGLRTMALLPDGRLAAVRREEGYGILTLVDLVSGEVTDVRPDREVTDVWYLSGTGERVLCRAMLRDELSHVVTIDPATGTVTDVEHRPSPVPAGYAPQVEATTWPGYEGQPTHGFLYLPTSPTASAPEGDLPPLIVQSHGGPTAATSAVFSPGTAYWTSRGYAVLDVNYGGSTGFGRDYRERLDGLWGIADVEDCVSGARHLAEAGRVDGSRLLITGGSAGGFTTLAALTFHDVFTAGASHYGISDLETLASDTHKFEARYPDGLVGPLPEALEVYRKRSPIHHVDGLSAPLLILQGADDEVVPPAQAELMADALRGKGLPVALLVFEGEGHGFRDPANVRRALEAETSFYAQVLGLPHPDDIEPVEVENL